MWEPPEMETMEEGAVMIHEWFRSLRESGFTKHECWHIMLEKIDCERPDCTRPGSP